MWSLPRNERRIRKTPAVTVLGPRSTEPERLDAPPSAPSAALDDTLRHVALVNRWLGGERALRLHLALLRRTGGEVSVLDVGTGNAVLLKRIIAWGERGGGRWWGVGVDLHPQMLAAARRAVGGLPLVRAHALALPFPPRSFQVALCTLTLHHFSDDEARALVRELARVARRLVLVNDLARGLPGYLSARLFSSTWWRANEFTRHDGPLSVLRSFTPDELVRIGREGGLSHVTVRRRFPFRLILEGRP